MASDIQTKSIIFRYTPEKAHPYLKLMRIDRPIGTWLLLFPCWWSLVLAHGHVYNMGMIGWRHAILFAIGAILMRGAGCVVNDLWDRNLDQQVERTKTRPLASGEMTTKQALLFLASLLSLGLIVLLSFKSNLATAMGAASLALVAVYPLMKRITWWPQFFLGLTFNWGAFMGFAVTTDSITIASALLYIGGILWTLAYDTIYAHQDMEDDATVGIKSTALLFGDRSKKYVTWFFVASVIFLTAAKFWAAPSFMTPLLLLLPAGHVFWMLRHWNPADPASSLKIFKANRDFAAAVLVMFSL